MKEHSVEIGVAAAKVAPPSIVTAATFLGYPIEHWILWLTFAWWVWLLADKVWARGRKAYLRWQAKRNRDPHEELLGP